jgi:hypothetical protein
MTWHLVIGPCMDEILTDEVWILKLHPSIAAKFDVGFFEHKTFLEST